MLARSKLETNWRACSSASRSTISPRVGVSAVAVSAMRGTAGKRSCNIVSARYSGRKSWPHCETQCASSIANRAMPACTPSPPAGEGWGGGGGARPGGGARSRGGGGGGRPPPPPPPRGGGGGGGGGGGRECR